MDKKELEQLLGDGEAPRDLGPIQNYLGAIASEPAMTRVKRSMSSGARSASTRS